MVPTQIDPNRSTLRAVCAALAPPAAGSPRLWLMGLGARHTTDLLLAAHEGVLPLVRPHAHKLQALQGDALERLMPGDRILAAAWPDRTNRDPRVGEAVYAAALLLDVRSRSALPDDSERMGVVGVKTVSFVRDFRADDLSRGDAADLGFSLGGPGVLVPAGRDIAECLAPGATPASALR